MPYTKHKLRVSVRCGFCGMAFENLPSDRKRYCSKSCGSRARSPWTPIEEALLEDNYPHMTRSELAALLRKEVKAIDHKIRTKYPHLKKQQPALTLACVECGSSFVRPVSLATAAQPFCSVPCKGAWQSANIFGPASPTWKGGYTYYYGPNWTQQRQRARSRDGYMCQVCGVLEILYGRELDVHHIRPFREFGGDYEKANVEENLVSLCKLCHQLSEHGHYRWHALRGVPMLWTPEAAQVWGLA